MRRELVERHILACQNRSCDQTFVCEEIECAINRRHPDILLCAAGPGSNLSGGQRMLAVEQDIPDAYPLFCPLYALRPIFGVQESVLLFDAVRWFYHRRSSFESQGEAQAVGRQDGLSGRAAQGAAGLRLSGK